MWFRRQISTISTICHLCLTFFLHLKETLFSNLHLYTPQVCEYSWLLASPVMLECMFWLAPFPLLHPSFFMQKLLDSSCRFTPFPKGEFYILVWFLFDLNKAHVSAFFLYVLVFPWKQLEYLSSGKVRAVEEEQDSTNHWLFVILLSWSLLTCCSDVVTVVSVTHCSWR